MPSCVLKTCKNYQRKFKKSHGITYHVFPKQKNRKDDWVQIIRNCRGESDWNPSSASTVCSAHFDDDDFIISARGLRLLVPNAIPRKLLSKPPEIQTPSKSSHILQNSSNTKEASYQPPPSSSSTIPPQLQEPVLTDEFVLSGYCRLCANSKCDPKSVNIQNDDVLEKIVERMSNRLNINIDFSQKHLPTTICPVCVKSLYTAYDFVVGIDLAQMTLNKISMQKIKCEIPENLNLVNNMDLSNTSLQQANSPEANNLEQPKLHAPSTAFHELQVSPNTTTAESNFDQPLLLISNMTGPVLLTSHNTGATTSYLEQLPLHELGSTVPVLLDSPRKRKDNEMEKDNLDKKNQIIQSQKKNLKRLNQIVRRLRNRNESLKNRYYKKP